MCHAPLLSLAGGSLHTGRGGAWRGAGEDSACHMHGTGAANGWPWCAGPAWVPIPPVPDAPQALFNFMGVAE